MADDRETPTKEAKLVVCYVCGAGSHREDWQDGQPHACDSHTVVEKAKAASAGQDQATPAKKTAKT